MTYASILIATDLSAESLQAARLAARIAPEGARVRIAMVLTPGWVPGAGPVMASEAAQQRAAERVTEWARTAGLPRAEVVVPRGAPSREIARESMDLRADLVALGAKGRTAVAQRLLGGTARGVLRRVMADTLVVRGEVPPADAPALRHILVATDFHPPSAKAAERASELARAHDARLTLIHAVDPSIWYDPGLDPDEEPIQAQEDPAITEHFAAFQRKHLAGAADAVVVRGRPAQAIAEYATENGVDLIVIGNHGAGAIERALLGSAAESIVELAPASVLVVRA